MNCWKHCVKGGKQEDNKYQKKNTSPHHYHYTKRATNTHAQACTRKDQLTFFPHMRKHANARMHTQGPINSQLQLYAKHEPHKCTQMHANAKYRKVLTHAQIVNSDRTKFGAHVLGVYCAVACHP